MLMPDEKKLWLDALRSHKFKQGKHCLCKNGEHCALGVFEEITGNLEWHLIGEKRIKGTDRTILCSLETRDKIGFEAENHLIYMNDRENKSFFEIADWIETNL